MSTAILENINHCTFCMLILRKRHCSAPTFSHPAYNACPPGSMAACDHTDCEEVDSGTRWGIAKLLQSQHGWTLCATWREQQLTVSQNTLKSVNRYQPRLCIVSQTISPGSQVTWKPPSQEEEASHQCWVEWGKKTHLHLDVTKTGDVVRSTSTADCTSWGGLDPSVCAARCWRSFYQSVMVSALFSAGGAALPLAEQTGNHHRQPCPPSLPPAGQTMMLFPQQTSAAPLSKEGIGKMIPA